jgi:hypothetical protein
MARRFATLAEVRKFIAQAVDPAEQAAMKVCKEIQYSGELVALSKATDARQVDVAQMHAKLVVQQVKKAEGGLALFETARARIREVVESEGVDIEPETKNLERRMQRIDEARDLLARVIAQANDFLDDCAKMVKTVGTSDTAVLAEWSRTMVFIRRVEPRIEELTDKGRKLTVAAQQAAQARDAAALRKLQAEAKAMQDMLRKDPPPALIKQKILEFQKGHDPRLMSKTVLAQFTRDVREATELAAGLGKRYEVCLGQLDVVSRHEIQPPDAARAIKVLGLKSTVLADMKKALQKADAGGDATAIKEFDLIARDAGLRLSGKDMLTKLRREKVF